MRQATLILFFSLMSRACWATEDPSWKALAKSAFERLIGLNNPQKLNCNCKGTKPKAAILSAEKDLSFLENLRPISRIHFEKYCQRCHQQWPFDNDEKFKIMVRGMGSSMIFQLENNLMPKANSQIQLSDKMRSDMIQFLKNFK